MYVAHKHAATRISVLVQVSPFYVKPAFVLRTKKKKVQSIEYNLLVVVLDRCQVLLFSSLNSILSEVGYYALSLKFQLISRKSTISNVME